MATCYICTYQAICWPHNVVNTKLICGIVQLNFILWTREKTRIKHLRISLQTHITLPLTKQWTKMIETFTPRMLMTEILYNLNNGGSREIAVDKFRDLHIWPTCAFALRRKMLKSPFARLLAILMDFNGTKLNS